MLRSMETSGSACIGENALLKRAIGGSATSAALTFDGDVALRHELEVDDRGQVRKVGTRIDTPSSLPLQFRSTRPTALAAPVEVGIMETARARVEVLCMVSSVGWSPV